MLRAVQQSQQQRRIGAIDKQLSKPPAPLRDLEDLVSSLAAPKKADTGGCGSSSTGGCACESPVTPSEEESLAAKAYLARLDGTVRTAAANKVEYLLGSARHSAAVEAAVVAGRTHQAAAVVASGAAATTADDHSKGVVPVGEGMLPAIQTAEEYLDSLRGRGLKVYLFGELLEEAIDHPMIAPSVNAVAETFRLGQEQPELGTALSPLSGYRCNRFLHITTSADDVVMQNKMQRALGQRTGTCFQRCVGMDCINSCYSTTYDIDAAHGTNYHERFQAFVREMQANNFVIGGAMTDPKGDRSLGPSEQADPDLFVHIVERRIDGVVIQGAKMHQTGCINSHWLITMPGGRMVEGDEDYAAICAIPADHPNLTFIYGRQSCDTRSMEDTATDIDQGNAKFGGQEATVIFDRVFVPNEHIFMNGEIEFAAELVERFTAYHRRSYICKAGLGDVLIGAAAVISDYNGTAKASHIKDKLVEMAYLNENIAGTAMAASFQSNEMPAGNYQPNVLMANVCKHNVTRYPYDIARIAQDLAGGLMSTLPSDQDFEHEVTGPLLRKYLTGAGGATVDNKRRILRLIENMTMGRNAVGYLVESTHGAGSPFAQRLLIQRLMDLDGFKGHAKNLAGVEDA